VSSSEPTDIPFRLAARIEWAAAASDEREAGMREGLSLLREAGLLRRSMAQSPEQSARILTRVAEANLSLARLFEGHINVLRLFELYGSDSQLERAEELADQGRLFGVWGADASTPVAISADGRLSGSKRYASGLGLVDHALVTAQSAEGQRLLFLDVTDTARHCHETWEMSGMQATASGDFNFDGMTAEARTLVGEPGSYMSEPGFVSGTWRIAAVQLGGTLGLLRKATTALHDRGHLEAEAHLARLAPILIRALAAGSYIVRAAETAEGPAARAEPERAAVLSAASRLLTEEIGQAAIAAVEQSVGLRMFERQSTVGRAARDLATYMRQVARDAFLMRVARYGLLSEQRLSDLCYD
jgi:alkylation response protein AidB-like acyl-CoA dehydrogenase